MVLSWIKCGWVADEHGNNENDYERHYHSCPEKKISQ